MSEIKRNPLNGATMDSNTVLNPIYERLAEVVLSEENIGDNLELDYSGGYVQLVGNEGDVISEAYVGGGGGTAVVVEADDKLLSLDGPRLSSNISLVYSDVEKKIKLIGKDGSSVISEVDSSDFVKDSFLKSASYEPTTKNLVLVFVDADGTEDTVNIDMSSLADTYTAGNGITIVSNEVSIAINPDSTSLLSTNAAGLSAAGVATALMSKSDVSVVNAINTRLVTAETKLGGVAEGAEVNVQSDWSVTDTESDAFIANKPTIPSIDGLATTTYVDTQDALKQDVLVSGTSIKTVNGESILGSGNIVVSGGGGDVQSVNGKQGVVVLVADDIADVYSKTEVDTEIDGAVATKQDILVSGTSIKTVNGETLLGSGNIVVSGGGGDVQSVNGKQGVVVLVADDIADVYSKTEVDATLVDKADAAEVATMKTKLDGIAEGAEVNVQSDWNVTDSTSDAFIANKPTIPSIDGLATETYVDDAVATKANSIDVYNKTETYTKTEVDAELDTKVVSVTSTDDAIEVGGTATAPTIGLKIDDTASAGNVMLEVTAEGLKASANITQFQTIVVDALPAEGSSLYYYLVKTATEDLYNEYVWSEVSTGVFEFVFLGDTSVDLSDYVTNEELTAALTLKANVTTTDAIATRIDGVDTRLATAEGEIDTLQVGLADIQGDLDVVEEKVNTIEVSIPVITSLGEVKTIIL